MGPDLFGSIRGGLKAAILFTHIQIYATPMTFTAAH